MASHNASNEDLALALVSIFFIFIGIIEIKTGVSLSLNGAVRRSEDEFRFWFSVWFAIGSGVVGMLIALYGLAPGLFSLR